jgi:hypothetical protein
MHWYLGQLPIYYSPLFSYARMPRPDTRLRPIWMTRPGCSSFILRCGTTPYRFTLSCLPLEGPVGTRPDHILSKPPTLIIRVVELLLIPWY